jgi:site-specific DNA-methyltransferase (adenine-specific)
MIHHGDCLEVLKTMPDNSVDAVVTDPPYGISFMGKKWDYDVPSVEIWQECLRVLKPGGHLLAFAGTRTQHRMAVRIEDAGFEIRDMIAWLYGSGFPKSMDVGKAIDKQAGAKREVVGHDPTSGLGANSRLTDDGWHGVGRRGCDITAPATESAKQWDGWGSAIKPAMEPITLARKPLDGTIAQNVLKWGVGGINIDGCRVGTETMTSGGSLPDIRANNYNVSSGKERLKTPVINKEGRFPSNIIHDGSDEVLGLFPDAKSGKANVEYSENNSAARFFYCAKASKSERGKFNDHPTVKPTKLMRYLCRLVTPPNGIVLDPFAGSGTTLIAAIEEGFNPIGIERDKSSIEIINKRLAGVQRNLLWSNVGSGEEGVS